MNEATLRGWSLVAERLDSLVSHNLIALAARFGVGAVFFYSGRTKVSGLLTVNDNATFTTINDAVFGGAVVVGTADDESLAFGTAHNITFNSTLDVDFGDVVGRDRLSGHAVFGREFREFFLGGAKRGAGYEPSFRLFQRRRRKPTARRFQGWR